MVTSLDVAKLAGVSQPTVSRALRGDKRVATATREKVEAAAKALGYVPSAAGRALSSGKTNRIGLLVTDLSNEFYHRVIGPVVQAVQGRGQELVLLAEGGDGDAVADRIISLGMDGVILATTTTTSMVPYRLRERNIPFVYFNRVNPSIPSDAAVTDPSEGMLLMLDAAIRLGHTSFGLISGPDTATTSATRERVLRNFLVARGIKVGEDRIFRGEFKVGTGIEGMRRLMESPDRPTVVFCGNDVIAIGAINYCASAGITVPAEVSITGFDDLPEAAWPVFSLATVSFDLEELVRSAVELIYTRIEQPEAPFREIVLPTTFVHRSSLGEPCSQRS